MRAAYIYDLTKFIEWDESKEGITVCPVGDKSTGLAIQGVLNGKRADGRTIHVVLATSDSSFSHCDVVYVAGTSPGAVRVLHTLNGSKILTIGDTEYFAKHGGMIGLIRAGDQIQLVVNANAASAAGIQISSRVLDLAVIVHSVGAD